MTELNFYYKIPPYNINKVYAVDFSIYSQIQGYKAIDTGYDFKNSIRRLTYDCKSNKVKKLISNAMKSKVKTLSWEYHDKQGNR
jgi:hypothetical protein